MSSKRVKGYVARSTASRIQQVRDQLEAAIDRGDYQPGDRRPSERELVSLLGGSRVGIREAIRSLEALGRVEVRHGQGCFVAASRSDQHVKSFAHRLQIPHDLHETFNESRQGALQPLGRPAEPAREHDGIIAAIERANRRAARGGRRHLDVARASLITLLNTTTTEGHQ